MRQRQLLLLLILPCLLVTGVVPAAAQTSGPTPTSGPQATGTALLSAMRTAVITSGTLHAVLEGSGTVPGKMSFTTEVIADVSLKNESLHTATTSVQTNMVKHTSNSDRTELKVTDGRGAWRVPHTEWQCQALMPADVSSDLLAFQAQPKTARVTGTGTVNGVAVWKVTGKAVIAPWTGQKTRDVVEFDIAQSTGLPLRISTTFATRWGQSSASETLVETYSNFGAPLSITLPKKCR